MRKRKTTRVTVFARGEYDRDWPRGTLLDVISWFQEKLCVIPEEYRAVAKCEISSETEWDVCGGRIEIIYVRQETDSEMNNRITSDKWEQDEKERQERAQLACLQAKYYP